MSSGSFASAPRMPPTSRTAELEAPWAFSRSSMRRRCRCVWTLWCSSVSITPGSSLVEIIPSSILRTFCSIACASCRCRTSCCSSPVMAFLPVADVRTGRSAAGPMRKRRRRSRPVRLRADRLLPSPLDPSDTPSRGEDRLVAVGPADAEARRILLQHLLDQTASCGLIGPLRLDDDRVSDIPFHRLSPPRIAVQGTLACRGALCTERGCRPLVVRRRHPEDHPVAARSRSGRRDRGDVDAGLRELRRRLGNGAHAVVALDQEGALPLAERHAGLPGRLLER